MLPVGELPNPNSPEINTLHALIAARKPDICSQTDEAEQKKHRQTERNRWQVAHDIGIRGYALTETGDTICQWVQAHYDTQPGTLVAGEEGS